MVKKRILWIDLLRGLGMFFIIWGHSLSNAQSFLVTMLFEVNVPLFFILSGYLYHEQKISVQVYKLFYNLLLPYIVTCAFMAFNTMVANLTGGELIFKSMGSLKDVIKASIFAMGTPVLLMGTHINVPAIGAIWFLIALLWDEILFNFLVKKTISKGYFGIFMSIFSIILLVLGFELTHYGILPWSLNASMIGFGFMWGGYLLKKSNFLRFSKIEILIISLLLFLGWCLAGVFKVYFWMNIAATNNIFLAILSAFCGSFFLILLMQYVTNSQQDNEILRFISLYGKYSLIVLCVHIIDGNTYCLNRYIGLLVTKPIWLITLFNLCYHVAITIFGIYVVTKIPFLKSIYDNRERKFTWQK